MEHPSVKDKKRFRALRALCAAALLCLALGGASALVGLPAFAAGEGETLPEGTQLSVRVEGEHFTYTGGETAAAGADYVLTLDVEDYYTISTENIFVYAEPASGGGAGGAESAVEGWALQADTLDPTRSTLTVPASALEALDAAQTLVVSVQPYYAQPLLTVDLPAGAGAEAEVQIGEGAAQPYTEAVRFDAGQDLTVTVAFSSQNYYIENAAELGFVFDPDTWTYTWTREAATEDVSLAPVFAARAQAAAPAEDAFAVTPVIGENGHVQQGGIALAAGAGIAAGALEYRAQGEVTYAPFPAAGISGLAAAETYEVRFAATETHFASDSVQITVEQQYVVTLSAPAGTAGLDSAAVYVVAGESCTLPAVTLAGYTLSGWYTQSGPAGNESYSSVGVGGASYAPSGDVTLYARWELNAPALDAGEDLSFTYGEDRTLTASATLAAAAGNVTASYVWTRGTQRWTTASITDDELLSVNTYTYTCTVTMTTDLAREYCADDTSSATDSVTVTVEEMNIGRDDIVFSIKEQTYTGSAITLDSDDISAAYYIGGEKVDDLVLGTDFTITVYADNENAGTAKAYIKGTGNYKSSRINEFTIEKKNIGDADVKFTIANKTYTGSAIELTDADITAAYLTNDLVLGTDYIVGYAESVNYTDVTGTAVSVTVTGCGNYQGSIDVNFTIAPKSIAADAEDPVSASVVGTFTYTGAAITLGGNNFTLQYNDKGLTLDTDFTIAGYANNKNAGDATVTVTGKGNYEGSRTLTFTIAPVDIDTIGFYQWNDPVYTGEDAVPAFTVRLNGQDVPLVAGTDFDIYYFSMTTTVDPVNVTGTPVYFELEGKGNFTGRTSQSLGLLGVSTDVATRYSPDFTILRKDIADGDVTFKAEDVTYTGSAIELKDGDIAAAYTAGQKVNDLVLGTDYIVSYEAEGVDYTNVTGTAVSVTVTGQGNYGGEIELTFRILAKDISSSDVEFTIAQQTYTGSAITLDDDDISAAYLANTLSLDTHFIITGYADNTDAMQKSGKQASVTVAAANANYTGSVTLTFAIAPRTLSIEAGSGFKTTIQQVTYTGEALTPSLGIMYNGTGLPSGDRGLILDEDYTVVYHNNVQATREGVAQAYIAVTGKGNFTGSIHVDFTILPRPLEDEFIAAIAAETYTGKEIEPAPSVTYNGMTLGLGTDYTVEYSNNTAASQKSGSPATVTITGTGNYQGTASATFTILSKDITAEDVTIGQLASLTYTGGELTPVPVIKYSEMTLEAGEGKDFTVGYDKNVAAGTATVTVTGIGNYQGSTQVSFTILAKNIEESDVAVTPIAALTYTGGELTPVPVITYNTRTLEVGEGKDFTVKYSANTAAGTATVTVTGIGNYKGSIDVPFTIEKKDIGSGVSFAASDQTYTGSAIELQNGDVTALYVAGEIENVLVLGTDYTIGYAVAGVNYTDVTGAAVAVTVKGIGNYEGEIELTFTILAKNIADSDVSFAEIGELLYTGEALTPSLSATYNDKPLVAGEDADYTAEYGNNKDATQKSGAQASVTVKGVGNYAGERTLTFTIARKSVEDKDVSFEVEDVTYTGLAVQLADADIAAGYLENDLALGRDYTIEYEGDCTNVTEAGITLAIAGIGNYTGETSLTFHILAKSIAADAEEPVSASVVGTFTYTGSAIELLDADIQATYLTNDLKMGRDYTVSYADNTAAGDATVTLEGIGNYAGKRTLTFTIGKRALEDGFIAAIQAQTYTGGELTPALTVTYNGNSLALGTDYTVSYGNNVDATQKSGFLASVVIEGSGNYKGSASASFTILPKNITAEGVVIGQLAALTYTGGELTPVPVIEYNEMALEVGEGKDFTVGYADNTAAGTATVALTGIGNYTGYAEVSFTIRAKDISAEDVAVASIDPLTYTGGELTPVPVITYNGMTLVVGAENDFTVAYENNTDATQKSGAQATVVIAGVGNYQGRAEVSFTISPRALEDEFIAAIADQTYTGEALTPSLTVTYNNMALALGEEADYTVSYGNNTDATQKSGAPASVVIEGVGNYTGSASASFTILPRALQNGFIAAIADQAYTGEALTPSLTVTYNGMTLEVGEDYAAEYAGNTDATQKSGAQASVVIGGVGNYTGSAEASFTILPRALQDGFIADIADQTYTGEALTPALTVTYNGMALALGEDYEAAYDNNIDATQKSGAQATVVIEGVGNYAGTVRTAFTILPRALQDGFIADIADQTYTGAELTPSLTVTYNGMTLEVGEDYAASYGNNTDATQRSGAPASVVIEGVGNYAGSAEASFTILPRALQNSFIAPIADQTYTSYALCPAPEVTYNGMTLRAEEDHTVVYEENIDAGEALVRLAGVGNYTGSAEASFTILPRTVDESFTFVIAGGDTVGFLKNTAAGDYAPEEISVAAAMGEVSLARGRDFSVTWLADGAPLAADTPLYAQTITVAVTGVGNYAGTYVLAGEGSQLHIWAVRVSAGGENSYFDAADEALASLGGGEYTVALYEDAASPAVLRADASVALELRGYDLAGVTVEAGSLTLRAAQEESALGDVDVREGGALTLEGSFAAGAVDAYGDITVAGALSADAFRSLGSLAVAEGGTLAAQSLSFEGGSAAAAGTLAGGVSLSGASLLLKGYIDGSVTLTAGALSLEGGVSGSVLVTGGALAVTGGSVAGAVGLSGGTLTASGASQIGALSVSGGAATLGGSLTVTAAGDAVTYTGGSLTISPDLEANFACGGADIYVAPGCTLSASGYAGDALAVTTEADYCGTFAIAEGSTAFALQEGRADLLLVPEGGGVALYSLEQVALSMPETSGTAVVYEGAAYRGGDVFTAPYGSDLSLELLPDAGYILADVAVTEGASLTQEGENFERVAIGGLVSDVTLTVSVLRIAEDFFRYTPPAEPVYGVSGEQLVLGGGIEPAEGALAAVWNTVSLRWYIGADGAYTELIDLRPTDLNAQTPYYVYVTFAGDNIGDTGYIYAGSFELLPLTITADDFLPVDATWIYIEGGTPTEVDAVEIVPTGEKAALMEEDGLVSDLSVYFAGNGVAISDGWSQPSDFVGEYAGEYIVCLMLLGDSVNAVNYLPDGVQVAYTVFIDAGTLHVNLPQVDNDNVSVEGGSGIPDGVTVRSSAVLEGSAAFWSLEGDAPALAEAAGYEGNAVIEYVYDIRLVVEETGEEYTESTGSSYTIRIEIPEPLLGTEFSILHIHGDVIDDLDYTVEGRQAIIRVQDFSYFVFVTPELSLYLPIFVGLAVAAALLALVIATAVRRRRFIKKEEVLLSALSIAAFSKYPAGQLYMLLGIGALIVLLILVELWLLLDMRRRKKIAAEEARRAELRAKRAAADPLRRFIRTDIRREDVARPAGGMAGHAAHPARPAPAAPPESPADAEKPSIYALARSTGRQEPRKDPPEQT